MAFSSRWVYPDKSVPFGKYCRSRPLVFSLVPRCQGLCGSAKNPRMASRCARRSCSAISVPRSSVNVLRRGVGTGLSFRVNPSRALRASVPSSLARITRRVVRSTRLPTAELLRAPLIRSPSQWPGTVRVATSAGRSASRVMWESGPPIDPTRARPAGLAGLPQRGQQFAPSGRVATRTGLHRWSRPRGVSACPQDTRDGGGRQSVRASIRGSDVSGHTVTARDPGVCAAAEAVTPELPPACERCRPDRGGPSPHDAQTRG